MNILTKHPTININCLMVKRVIQLRQERKGSWIKESCKQKIAAFFWLLRVKINPFSDTNTVRGSGPPFFKLTYFIPPPKELHNIKLTTVFCFGSFIWNYDFWFLDFLRFESNWSRNTNFFGKFRTNFFRHFSKKTIFFWFQKQIFTEVANFIIINVKVSRG